MLSALIYIMHNYFKASSIPIVKDELFNFSENLRRMQFNDKRFSRSRSLLWENKR